MKKIVSTKTLANIISKLKVKGKKVVLCHGVFDLLHIGHIKHLKKAKELGDKLVVTITSDRYVNKGPNRPVFNQNLRYESIAALEPVDYVAINDSPTAINTIKVIKPNILSNLSKEKNIKNLIVTMVGKGSALYNKTKNKYDKSTNYVG